MRAVVRHDASNASLILMTQLQEPLRALEALRGVFSVSRQPSRAEMRAATENWLGSGAVRAMGWSERVRREDIAAFEARARADGNPGYRVFDRPDSANASAATAIDRLAPETRVESGDVIAIRQIEPIDSNATALGVNAMSVPAARAAILAAVETGRPAATAGFRLTQQSEQRPADGRRRLPGDLRPRGHDRRPTGAPPSAASSSSRWPWTRSSPPWWARCRPTSTCASSTATTWRRAGGSPAAPAAMPRRPAWSHERPYAFAGRQWDLRVTARPQDVPDALDRSAWLFSPPPGCCRRRCSAPRS